MSVQNLSHGIRKARKHYRCAMCNALIRPGERHNVQTNVFDGHIYDWRDCLPCQRDLVVTYVHDWTGRDEGVDYEAAMEWAEDAATWGRDWNGRPRSLHEVRAGRAWLARAVGGEGE